MRTLPVKPLLMLGFVPQPNLHYLSGIVQIHLKSLASHRHAIA